MSRMPGAPRRNAPQTGELFITPGEVLPQANRRSRVSTASSSSRQRPEGAGSLRACPGAAPHVVQKRDDDDGRQDQDNQHRRNPYGGGALLVDVSARLPVLCGEGVALSRQTCDKQLRMSVPCTTEVGGDADEPPVTHPAHCRRRRATLGRSAHPATPSQRQAGCRRYSAGTPH